VKIGETRCFCLLLLLAVWVQAGACAEEITIAAASDLTFALSEVAIQFQKETSNSVKLSFGSSGNFYSQIQNGAPYDLFFSADLGYPKRLEAAGLIEPGSLYPYATGKIVLWVSNESRIDTSRGLQSLLDPGVRKVAIANPEHAPYGRAAVAAMQHDHVYERVRNKLVLGESISQAAQFVVSGNVDMGILAFSLALAPTLKGRGRYYVIPPEAYPPIEQASVILKSSHKKQTAQKFLAFLRKPGTVDLMRRYGFDIPERTGMDPAPKQNSRRASAPREQ